MSIITFLGKSITEYQAKRDIFLSQKHFFCPLCGAPMKPHSTYDRSVKDYGVSIDIQRFCCVSKVCKHTQAVLPDFLVPYKHYSALEIESVLMDAVDVDSPLAIDTPISISTVRRWLHQFTPFLEEAISQLKALMFKKSGNIVTELSLCLESPIIAIQQLLTHLPDIYYTCFIGAAFILRQSLDGFT
jgi:hypothetical protein